MTLRSTAFLWALVATIFLECVLAAPHQRQKRSFRVDRAKHGTRQRNAANEVRKAYQKFGIPLPDGLGQPSLSQTVSKIGSTSSGTSSGSGGESGKTPNQPKSGDVEFLAPITVGGQQLMMDFDTGSSDLWMFSTLMPASQSQGHVIYDPKKSQTFKELQGSKFLVKFGDGSAAEGIVGTDTVDIGGATATGQAIELATAVASSFTEDTASNGLVGLAFSNINAVKPKKQTTFLDTIQNDLALPVMTANLRSGQQGFYEFGQIDSTAFKGSLASTPVNSSAGFWQFQSNKFQIGNGQVQTSQRGSDAIADTGTTLMLVDDDIANAYWDQVQGAQLDPQQQIFTFPCNAQLPDFHVALGADYMATIPGSIINFNQVDAETCAGGLQGNQGSNLQIYGDIMFKSQFVVFNIRDKTISFADHA